jgi:hypothetical protein
MDPPSGQAAVHSSRLLCGMVSSYSSNDQCENLAQSPKGRQGPSRQVGNYDQIEVRSAALSWTLHSSSAFISSSFPNRCR